MSKRLRQEDGIALVMALGITVVLIIFVASMIDYTSSNSRAARLSSSDLMALQYADAGLNAAYSIIVNQNVTSGGNPSAANLLGCNGAGGAADTTGPSNCATPTAKVICVTTSGCGSGDPGSATVYGYYSGVNPGTYNGNSVTAATWLLVSSGYARNPQGSTVIKTTTATVVLSPLNAGAVAAVWNHMFLTSPLVPNTCSVDFGGNNMMITDPIYVIGNMCISGQNTTVQETTGQPIDLMVGGKLVLSGSGSKVGTDCDASDHERRRRRRLHDRLRLVGDHGLRQRQLQLLGRDEGHVHPSRGAGDAGRRHRDRLQQLGSGADARLRGRRPRLDDLRR